MRKGFRVALACLLGLGVHTSALAGDRNERGVIRLKHDYTAAYTLQRVSRPGELASPPSYGVSSPTLPRRPAAGR